MHPLYLLALLFSSVSCYKGCYEKLPTPLTEKGNPVRGTFSSPSSDLTFIYTKNDTVSHIDASFYSHGYSYSGTISMQLKTKIPTKNKLVFAWLPYQSIGNSRVADLQIITKSSTTEMQFISSHQKIYKSFKTDMIVQDYDLMTSEDVNIEPTLAVAGRIAGNGDHVIKLYKLDRQNAPALYHTITTPRTNGYLGTSKIIGGHINTRNSFVGLLYNNTVHVYNCVIKNGYMCTEAILTVPKIDGQVETSSFYVYSNKIGTVMLSFATKYKGQDHPNVHLYGCAGPKCFKMEHAITDSVSKLSSFYANKQVHHYVEMVDENDGLSKRVFSCDDITCNKISNAYHFPDIEGDDLIWGPDPLWGFGTANEDKDKTIIPFMIIPDADAGVMVPLCKEDDKKRKF